MRINPYELHINDPEFYDDVYTGPSKRRDKWAWSAKMFGVPLSIIGTVPHDLHRLRRAALNPYFSKQSVARLEPVIQSCVSTLCKRLKETQNSGEPVNLGVAYSALTIDVVTEYSFGKSYGFLGKPDFGPEWPAMLQGIGQLSHLLKQFGWLYPMMNALPTWFVALTNPLVMPLIQFENVCIMFMISSIQLCLSQNYC